MNENMSELKEQEKQTVVRSANHWVMGAVFILVGGVLLLRNVTGFAFENWWVLFWLIPLGGFVSAIWGQYRANGRLNSGLIIGAAFMVLMMAVFLFNLDFSTVAWYPSAEPMRWYAILNPDRTPRPAYTELRLSRRTP